MSKWFSTKVRYTKELESGKLKRVNEQFLIAAETFGDAEEKIIKKLSETIKSGLDVIAIATEDIHDIIYNPEAELVHKCKIQFLEEADNETLKKITQVFIVEADTVKESIIAINRMMANTTLDFSITAVVLSPIVEVFPNEDTL
mgnify:CR=1 FL=1